MLWIALISKQTWSLDRPPLYRSEGVVLCAGILNSILQNFLS